MPKYEVLLTAYRLVLVEADSEEEAVDAVREECTDSDWDIEDWTIESNIESDVEWDQAKASGATPIDEW